MKIKRDVLGLVVYGGLLGVCGDAIGQLDVSNLQRIQSGGFEGDKPFRLRFGTLGLGDEFDGSALSSPGGAVEYSLSDLITCRPVHGDYIATKNITLQRQEIISGTFTAEFQKQLHKKLGMSSVSINGIEYKGGSYRLDVKTLEDRVAFMKAAITYPGLSKEALGNAIVSRFGNPDLYSTESGGRSPA